MSQLAPVRDQVIIKPDEIETTTKSGIHLPEASAEKHKGKLSKGTIVAVGPGIQPHPMEVEVGDRVLLSEYGPKRFKHEGEEYLICPQYDILAKVL